MKKTVRELMSTEVHVVHAWETLDRAAQIMWERDCGCVPVVDASEHLCGMITDRDECMGAYTQGRRLGEIPVSSVCSKEVHSILADATLDTAESIMRRQRVRRLPVRDTDGVVVGLLSIADLAEHIDSHAGNTKRDGLSPMSMAATLEAVSHPRGMHPIETSPVQS